MISSKIKTLAELRKIILRLKARGKVVVFTNGCFDILHYGHAKYLEDAKKKGDILIVAVNSDASIKRIKGDKRPIVGQYDRLRLIASLESVDYAVLFNEDTPLKTIKELKPDILIKGSDWDKKQIAGSGIVLSRGGKVSTIKLIKGRSTTNLIKKIAKIF
ncbi:MAG: D-glycero-beta-D-manno-heptose 1-phosphate adenylyltransferase [Candidatus Omnitrophota bacterium]